jgi:hypothetical protein
MRKAGDDKEFRTLRGFLNGHEADEANYFAYSATLRIFGNIPDLDDITQRLGISPTRTHRRGELLKPDSPPWKDDLWSFTAPVSENERFTTILMRSGTSSENAGSIFSISSVRRRWMFF